MKDSVLNKIPKEWSINTLGEISSLIKDGTHGTHSSDDSGIPLLSAKDINNNTILLSDDARRIPVEDFNKIHKNYKLKDGDILLTIVGTIGRTAIINNYKNNYTFQRSVAFIRLKENYEVKYFYHFFNSPYFQEQLKRNSNASAQAGVYLGALFKIPVVIPSLNEQQKIGRILSTVDEKLDAISQQIEQTQQFQKGMLQRLLTKGLGHAKFKDSPLGRIPASWVIKTISEFAQVTTGGKDTQNKIDSGKYPFFVRSQKIERINSYSFDGEAILTAGDGVGVGKVFHYFNGKFDYHQRVYNIYGFKDIVFGKYFFEYFKKNFIYQVNKYNAKGSVDSVRMEMITKMQVPIPPLQEQRRIAEILSLLEDKILLLEDKKESFQLFKRSLMQKLLTGKIRVNR